MENVFYIMKNKGAECIFQMWKEIWHATNKYWCCKLALVYIDSDGTTKFFEHVIDLGGLMIRSIIVACQALSRLFSIVVDSTIFSTSRCVHSS